MTAKPLTVTTPNDRDIVVRRFFNAPRTLVFDAHTKPELVRRWLYGPEGWSWLVCEIDLKVGGAYHYRWRHTDGREMGFVGAYRAIARPDGYIHTERFEGDDSGNEMLGTVVFDMRGNGTMMTYTMRAATAAARDAMLKSGMTRGMEIGYVRLDEYFASVA